MPGCSFGSTIPLESAETKEGQYSYDNDHQAHNVDDIVHRFILTDLKESNWLLGHWFQGLRKIVLCFPQRRCRLKADKARPES